MVRVGRFQFLHAPILTGPEAIEMRKARNRPSFLIGGIQVGVIRTKNAGRKPGVDELICACRPVGGRRGRPLMAAVQGITAR
jgi:hypothetical protein